MNAVFPLCAVKPAESVTVCWLPGTRLNVEGLADTPVGSDPIVTLTEELKPLIPAMETVKVFVSPAINGTD
jgi:hypothetical protein